MLNVEHYKKNLLMILLERFRKQQAQKTWVFTYKQHMVAFGGQAASFPQRLLQVPQLQGRAAFNLVVQRHRKAVLLKQVAHGIFQRPQPNEGLFIGTQRPLGVVGDGPCNLHKVTRAVLPRAA